VEKVAVLFTSATGYGTKSGANAEVSLSSMSRMLVGDWTNGGSSWFSVGIRCFVVGSGIVGSILLKILGYEYRWKGESLDVCRFIYSLGQSQKATLPSSLLSRCRNGKSPRATPRKFQSCCFGPLRHVKTGTTKPHRLLLQLCSPRFHGASYDQKSQLISGETDHMSCH
jgi:hypothetical protein